MDDKSITDILILNKRRAIMDISRFGGKSGVENRIDWIRHISRECSATRFCANVQEHLPGLVDDLHFDIQPMGVDDEEEISKNGINIGHSELGMVVDSVCRAYLAAAQSLTHGLSFCNLATEIRYIFKPSISGASLLDRKKNINVHIRRAHELIRRLTDALLIDDTGYIHYMKDVAICATELAYYEVAYRAGHLVYDKNKRPLPDKKTCQLIHTLAVRAFYFLLYQKDVESYITFAGAYSLVISSADADYLSHDTLWDMKNSKYMPREKDKLQLLVYYLMLEKTPDYNDRLPRYLAILNPVLGETYTLDIQRIDPQILSILRDSMYDPKEERRPYEKLRFSYKDCYKMDAFRYMNKYRIEANHEEEDYVNGSYCDIDPHATALWENLWEDSLSR